ncbi:hypothetical protein LTS17_006277 [Exophiala oligosperma]
MALNEANRFRAARACQRCHLKRVKCDAMVHGLPCTRCQEIGNDDCVLMQSKRGTYLRTRSRWSRSQNAQGVTMEPPSNTNPHHCPSPGPRRTSAPGLTTSSRRPGRHNEIPTSESAPSNTGDREPSVNHSRPSLSPTNAVSVSAVHQSNTEAATFPNPGFAGSPDSTHDKVSWITMFDKFFDDLSQDRSSVVDKCSITYLGESFPLAMVLEEVNDGRRPRLHHAGPPISEPSVAIEPSGSKHPPHMLPEDIAYLEAKGAFTFPNPDILDRLITTFLSRVYPLYPIVSRQEFLRQYETDDVPAMLLHMVCSIAATFCDLSLIHRAGFDNRLEARHAYYSKAKVLFEIGYETDKIVQLQSAVLMTFWGGGPIHHWNYFSWTGTAVTIAESLGIHRSMADTNMHAGDRSLLKRLWWTLLIRDAHCQSLVGRPFRINQQQVDIEPLTSEDFADDMQSPEFFSHPLRLTYGLYQIHMSKLCLILKDIVNTRLKPGRLTPRMTELYDSLRRWRAELPPELQWTDSDPNLDVFPLALCSMYNHHLILLHQDRPFSAPISDRGDASALLVESIPSPEVVSQGLFLAEAVFFTQMKSSEPMVAHFGRAALNSCQMLWNAVLDSWDASPWIQKLFHNLVERLGLPTGQGVKPLSDMSDQSTRDVSGPGDLADDVWAQFPTLSPFLDMVQDGGTLSNWVEFPIFSGSMDMMEPVQGCHSQPSRSDFGS